MPKDPRTKIKISILSHIVPRLAAEAKRKNWDIDLVLEEALIHYLDLEGGKKSDTRAIKSTEQPDRRIKKTKRK